jgi:DNA-directed RNA polymerase specialized sigma24 family protein
MDNHWAAGGKGPRPAVRSGICDKLTGLCECYLRDPENADIKEWFLRECIRIIRKKVNYHVVYRRKSPRFLAPGTFADDVFNLALVKFWAGIGSLRNPAKLNSWLGRVASSSVYDELRQFTRRKEDGPCEWETIETMRFSEDGNILDEETNRELTEYGHGLSCAPDLKQLAYRDLLDKVWNGNGNGSKDNERDWLVLKLSMIFEVDEIADQLGMAEPKVRYQLKKSKHRFRIIAKHRHKFSRSDI